MLIIEDLFTISCYFLHSLLIYVGVIPSDSRLVSDVLYECFARRFNGLNFHYKWIG